VWKRGGGFHSWRVSTPFIFYLCFQSYKITILTDLLLILFKLQSPQLRSRRVGTTWCKNWPRTRFN
jgi:hypothetical protein